MHAPTPPPVVAPPVVAPPVIGSQRDADPPALNPRDQSPPLIDRIVRNIKMGGVCLIVGVVFGQTCLLVRDHLRTADAADRDKQSKAIVSDSAAAQLLTAPSTGGETVSASIVSWRPMNQAAIGNGSNVGIGINRLELDTKSPGETELAEQTVASEPESITDSPQTLPTIPDTVGKVAVDERLPATSSEDSPTDEPIAADLSQVIDSLETLASPTKTAHPLCEDGTCQQRMESLGTTLQWADSPADAYRMAGEQDKLVFLIHVSGNFEIPGFT